MRSIRLFATAVAIPVLLTACGSGSSGGSSGTPLTSGEGFTGGGETFFNDVDGIKFADSIGGSFNSIFDAIFSGFGFSSSTASGTLTQRMKRASQSETTQCDSGSVTVTSTINDATSELTGINMAFNGCMTDGSTANGGMSLSISGTDPNVTIGLNFNNFTTTDNGEASSLNGGINISASESGSQTTTTISGSSFTMVSAGETVSFSNYSLNSVMNDDTDAASISGSATIATGEGTLAMSINPALATNGVDDYPSTGTIAWTHSDGSSLLIDADTGNINTFNYTVSDGASVSSGVGNWADTDVSGISL